MAQHDDEEEVDEEGERLLQDTLSHEPDFEITSQGRRCSGPPSEKRTTQTNPSEERVSWRNLPHKKKIFLLALCRLSTPLSNACLLPYLYYLVQSILSDPNHPSAPQHVSRLTGLLVAAFPLGQMLTSMLWGSLSDTHGRRPAILLGLLVSVIANLCFGFSRSIGMLLFWRVVAGMANGTTGVMRTMTAEIVKHRKYQTRAFLTPPVVFNSGRVAALAIGGCLADPMHNLPALFGPSGLFNVAKNPAGVEWAIRYPYALPALFNGVVLAMCWVAAVLWLRESLPSKENDRDVGLVLGETIAGCVRRVVLRRPHTGYIAVQDEESDLSLSETPAALPPCPRPSTRNHKTPRPRFRDLWTRDLLQTLVAFALLPLHNSTFLHIFPVFLSMPPSPTQQGPAVFHFTGGLGLPSPTIGLSLAAFGILGILIQLFVYPRLQMRIGTLNILRLASALFPLVYVSAPYLALLSSHVEAKWAAMAAVLFLQVMARTAGIPSTVVLLTEAAPTKGVLGTVHGAGTTVSALASAVGPVVGGVVLAWGIEKGVVGVVWWAWMGIIAAGALGWSLGVLRETGTERMDEEKGLAGD